jgi:hypothetical protein
MGQRPCLFKERNIIRAFKAARGAGITAPRVDIAPDGTISISQLTPHEVAKPSANGTPAADGLRSWD